MISEIKFYLSQFWRRIHYFLFIFLVIASIGVTLAYTLPPVYRAEARLLIESPQIPDDLAASTVRTETFELLQIIEQKMLTRANLLEMARRYEVYRGVPGISANATVDDMRDRVRIRLPAFNDTSGLVTVSFEAPSPALSAQVANELVTQILQQNLELRTSVSGETLEFFQQEVERLNAQLSEKGGEILEFKLANGDALPESLSFSRTRQSAIQERLLQIDRELSSLNDRRTRLQELFEQTGRLDLSEQSLTAEQQQLRELKSRLASETVIYSPTNPRVVSLRAQVEALEQIVATQISSGSIAQSDTVTAYELQIADIDAQISYLSDQKVLVNEELEELTASIGKTPRNAITLGALERDYDNIREQFNQATAGLAEARTGDRIEALSKGQRIVVIEQAVEPNSPSSPNRRLILAAGIGGGMMAGFGFLLVLELLNRAVRRPEELRNRLNLTPFAVLPYVRTRRQTRNRRLTIASILGSIVVGVPVILYTLHVYYLPMDMLVETVLETMGVAGLMENIGLGQEV